MKKSFMDFFVSFRRGACARSFVASPFLLRGKVRPDRPGRAFTTARFTPGARRFAADVATLRIFTERPACIRCRRVKSRLMADHPSIKLEVFYQAARLPASVGITAGAATDRAGAR